MEKQLVKRLDQLVRIARERIPGRKINGRARWGDSVERQECLKKLPY